MARPTNESSTPGRALALAAAAAACLSIAACNTIEGAGEDVQAVGQGVEEAAD